MRKTEQEQAVASRTAAHSMTASRDAIATADQLLQTQYAVAMILAESSTLSAAAPRMLEAVCEGLDWDVGEIWLPDPMDRELVLQHMWTRPGLDGLMAGDWRDSFSKDQGIPGEVWTRGAPFWIADVAAEKEFLRAEAARKADLHAVFGYPIQHRGDVLGVIEFFSRERRDVNATILKATESLGRQFGAFLGRTHAEAALRENDERLRIAMDAGQLGAWEWNIATNEVKWSERLERIHGLEPGTFAGTFDTYWSFVHADDRERVAEQIKEALESGTHDLEYRIVKTDGSVRWIAARGEVVRASHESPAKMVGVSTDVTDRREREQRQQFLSNASSVLSRTLVSDQILQELAELIVGDVADWCAIDLYDGHSIRRAVLAHRDPEKEELANRLRPYVHDPESVRETLTVLERGEALLYEHLGPAQLEGAAIDDEHLALMKVLGFHSAMIVPMRARRRLLGGITLICGEESRTSYTADDLALAEDLARRAAFALDNARLHQEAEDANKELRQANEFKDEFLGFVSHELRTPLTTIYGGAKILAARGEHLDAKSRNTLAKDIEAETERLNHLVEDLLVLARTEQRGADIPMEPLRVEQEIEHVIRRFHGRRTSKPLVVRVQDGMPLAMAEPVFLEQIMRNLLSNAEKHHPPGEPIVVSVERDGPEVVVSVLDCGPGVPPSELDRIFERFFHRSRTQGEAGGVGLGLAVCKRLVEVQGGRIWAELPEGGGLRIAFTLPVYDDESEQR